MIFVACNLQRGSDLGCSRPSQVLCRKHEDSKIADASINIPVGVKTRGISMHDFAIHHTHPVECLQCEPGHGRIVDMDDMEKNMARSQSTGNLQKLRTLPNSDVIKAFELKTPKRLAGVFGPAPGHSPQRPAPYVAISGRILGC